MASLLGPSFAARYLLTLFSTPRHPSRPAREWRVLRQGVPFRLVLESGRRISAWSYGAGPVVALVHGWEGRGSQLAEFIGPLVAAGFRVVIFDAPAHGDSSGLRTDVRDFAAALEAIARREGDIFAVIAHSLGGLATALAAHRGLEASRVVLLAPAPSPAPWLDWLSSELSLDETALALARTQLSDFVALEWAELAAGGAYDSLSTSLLIVHDQDDAISQVSGARALADRTGARYLETAGLGHNRLLRDERVVEIAVSFLAEGRAAERKPSGWQRFLRELDVELEAHAFA